MMQGPIRVSRTPATPANWPLAGGRILMRLLNMRADGPALQVGGTITKIHQQVADLLHGPGTVRVRGDPEDVQVAAAYLHDEQAVQPLQSHRAVHVEEIGGEHRRGLRVQELSPRRVGAPLRCRGIFSALSTRRIVDALTRWPSLSSSPWWHPALAPVPRRLAQ
jgi:hypothetical protein